ncbi:hypothetical protein STXM2123_4679 [Streptomyces sp. F-3]|nr:hypothetical protein STXM2123_4679 [Streptomyces sp. F-3]
MILSLQKAQTFFLGLRTGGFAMVFLLCDQEVWVRPALGPGT